MTVVRQLAVAALLLRAPTAAAETPLPPERPADAGAPLGSQKPAADTPPYQARLERLAEIMGTLTYLRDLCPPGDGAAWRGKMEELLTAEGTSTIRRDRLAGAFNRGFDGYRLTYRQCTPTVSLIVERTIAEGAQLAREIAVRFGT